MRTFPGSIAFALAVALALVPPSRAAFIEAAPLAPAFELARVNPGFRQELITQIGLASSLSAAPQPSLSAFTAPAAAPAGPWTHQAAALVGAVVARPAAAAALQPQVAAVLGPTVAAQLHDAAAEFAAKRGADAGLDAQLRQLTKGLDVEDHAAVAAFTAALFDNSHARPDASAPAVAAGEGPGRAPLVRLTKAGHPRMSAAELAEFVAKNKTVSPEGLVRLTFPSGQYHAEYDAPLKALGVHRVNIAEPSRAEVEELAGDAHDFRVVTDKVRWVMTTRTMEEHERQLADNAQGGKGSHATQFRKARESTKGAKVDPVSVLTVADWNAWYDIYENEVVGVDREGRPLPGKRQGRRAVARDMGKGAGLTDAFFKDDGWYGMLFRNEAGEVIGGDVFKGNPERGIFINGYAAYRPELKPYNPATVAFEQGNLMAAKAGYPVFSFGMDTNEYGHDYSLGLMSNKAGFLLQPFGEGTIMLSKILNTEKFAAHADKEGRTAGYGYFGPSDAVIRQYLADRDAGVQKPADLYVGRSFTADGGVVRSAHGFSAPEATVFHYYAGTAPALRTPRGVPVVKHAMAAPPAPAQ